MYTNVRKRPCLQSRSFPNLIPEKMYLKDREPSWNISFCVRLKSNRDRARPQVGETYTKNKLLYLGLSIKKGGFSDFKPSLVFRILQFIEPSSILRQIEILSNNIYYWSQ